MRFVGNRGRREDDVVPSGRDEFLLDNYQGPLADAASKVGMELRGKIDKSVLEDFDNWLRDTIPTLPDGRQAARPWASIIKDKRTQWHTHSDDTAERAMRRYIQQAAEQYVREGKLRINTQQSDRLMDSASSRFKSQSPEDPTHRTAVQKIEGDRQLQRIVPVLVEALNRVQGDGNTYNPADAVEAWEWVKTRYKLGDEDLYRATVAGIQNVNTAVEPMRQFLAAKGYIEERHEGRPWDSIDKETQQTVQTGMNFLSEAAKNVRGEAQYAQDIKQGVLHTISKQDGYEFAEWYREHKGEYRNDPKKAAVAYLEFEANYWKNIAPPSREREAPPTGPVFDGASLASVLNEFIQSGEEEFTSVDGQEFDRRMLGKFGERYSRLARRISDENATEEQVDQVMNTLREYASRFVRHYNDLDHMFDEESQQQPQQSEKRSRFGFLRKQ